MNLHKSPVTLDLLLTHTCLNHIHIITHVSSYMIAHTQRHTHGHAEIEINPQAAVTSGDAIGNDLCLCVCVSLSLWSRIISQSMYRQLETQGIPLVLLTFSLP